MSFITKWKIPHPPPFCKTIKTDVYWKARIAGTGITGITEAGNTGSSGVTGAGNTGVSGTGVTEAAENTESSGVTGGTKVRSCFTSSCPWEAECSLGATGPCPAAAPTSRFPSEISSGNFVHVASLTAIETSPCTGEFSSFGVGKSATRRLITSLLLRGVVVGHVLNVFILGFYNAVDIHTVCINRGNCMAVGSRRNHRDTVIWDQIEAFRYLYDFVEWLLKCFKLVLRRERSVRFCYNRHFVTKDGFILL